MQTTSNLEENHRPHAICIREAIIRGDDPRGVSALQKVRKKLSLTRPIDDCKELAKLCNNDEDGRLAVDPLELVLPGKDGTVHIGSRPLTS